jgi:DNA helicase-2/ATP-dependent DNA helicase PcrA
VLPDLGVDAVNQTTFIDFVKEHIGKKYKFVESDDKLKQLLKHEGDRDPEVAQILFVSELKGSMMFKDICEAYLQRIERDFVPNENLTLGEHVLYTYEDIWSLFHEQYQHLALYQRVDRIKKVFTHVVKSRLKEILKQIEEKYEQQIEKAIYSISHDAKRRETVSSLMDEKEAALDAVKTEAKFVVKQFIAKFPKKDVFQHYMELLLDLTREKSCNLEPSRLQRLCADSLELLTKKRVDIEDAAALLYLQHRLFGMTGDKAKAVVIDEAQDFSVFQFFALKAVLGTELFTILGDLSQGIHAYRGVNDWQNVINHVFPNAELLVLEQSYRTTVEIMEFANQIIDQSNTPGLVLAKPVVRHGALPTVGTFTDAKKLYSKIVEHVEKARNAGMRSIAVIAKTLEECNKIKKQLQPCVNHVQLLQGEEDIDPEGIVIVPAHISKGLEFDVVFVANVADSYSMTDLDIKLLYVACTRPLHELHLYQVKERIQPLQDIPLSYFNRLSV